MFILMISCETSGTKKQIRDYPITPVPFTKIELKDNFWSKRIKTNRDVTIPYGFKKCEEEGRIRNFERAGGLLGGGYEGLMPFDDSDIYKIIEGASYSLQTHPDEKLDKYIDDIIGKISAAQEEDGYLTTWKTINPDTTPAWWVKPGPHWFNLESSHELYNMGHLYEAAYAHFRATGKRNLLNIALKNAELIANTFGPDKLRTPPGHQIIESGLIKLFRATGDEKYLKLAKFFLDARGDSTGHKLNGSYNQDHMPVIKQDEAVGHAVRAVYMYAGMADIAALLQDKEYLNAIDRIWGNVVTKKLYLTGGVGARHEGESFGDNYELPNLTAYNETCAAIANVYWNHRMFLLHGHSKYIDVLERTLYNGLISGVSLSGDTFFYPNCLASDGKYKFNQGALTRKSWFDCSCCPTNIMRFMPSVPDYIYAQRNDSLYVNLFIANNARININENDIQITQKTDYPWDDRVEFNFGLNKETTFVLKIRIPGWAQNKPVPGDLYSYLSNTSGQYKIRLNGEEITGVTHKGYAEISRTWQDGDVVELFLPMPVRRVLSNELVADNKDKVALERGPVVYCAEWIDNGGRALDLIVPDDAIFSTEFKNDLLGGVTVIKGKVIREKGRITDLTAIPYYAWSHRGPGEMAVWLGRK
ncbi:MAG: glycoside hydrolase family 127 protein [Calditrichaeota bacterium]|nr:MAG: glycoside hydrolase family 127 protein [Calditrichota bacterium]